MARVNFINARKRLRRGSRRLSRSGSRTYRGQQGWQWVTAISDFTFTVATADVGLYFTLTDGQEFESDAQLKEAKSVALTRLIGQARLRYIPIAEVFPFVSMNVWIAKVADKTGGLFDNPNGVLTGTNFNNVQSYDVANADFHVLHWRTMWAANLGGFARFTPAADPTEVMLPAVGPFPPTDGEVIAASDVFARSMWDFDFNANWGMSDEEKIILGCDIAPNELLSNGSAIGMEVTTRQLVRKHR